MFARLKKRFFAQPRFSPLEKSHYEGVKVQIQALQDEAEVLTFGQHLEDLIKTEASRAENIEKKGTYLMAFVGLVFTFFGSTALNLVQKGGEWVDGSLLIAFLAMVYTVYQGWQTVRSRHYTFLSETSYLPPRGLEACQEQTIDLLYALNINRVVTNVRGGHLQAGERTFLFTLLCIGLAYLFYFVP